MPKRSSKPKGDANVIGFMVAKLATDSESAGGRSQGAAVGPGSGREAGEARGSGSQGKGAGVGETAEAPDQGKNPAAVALGRLGGLKGGKARAESLSAKKRVEIARKAAQARWKKRQ